MPHLARQCQEGTEVYCSLHMSENAGHTVTDESGCQKMLGIRSLMRVDAQIGRRQVGHMHPIDPMCLVSSIGSTCKRSSWRDLPCMLFANDRPGAKTLLEQELSWGRMPMHVTMAQEAIPARHNSAHYFCLHATAAYPQCALLGQCSHDEEAGQPARTIRAWITAE